MPTAEEIAGAMLGEEAVEQVQEQVEQEQPETAEEVEASAAPEIESEETETVEVEDDTDKKVPLKALMEEKRKRQEYEARLKELESRQAPQPQQPQTLEDLYVTDPKGTLSQINAEIERLATEDPYTNAANIERLRDLKIELREKATQTVNTQQGRFVQELNNAIPDFPKKVQALSDFAESELGYSQDTIQRLSNPGLVGPAAALDFIKGVARQFEAKSAKTTVTTKAVKPKPTQVESPGQGAKSSNESLASLREQGSKSRDWSKYLDAIGALD